MARNIGVSTCADSGSGSLRAAVGMALDGDIIDLGGLTCSTITLTTGALVTTASNLTIAGPFQVPPAITIDGGRLAGHYDRILLSIGKGLSLQNVALANAKYRSAQTPHGGCVATSGGLTMINVSLDNCEVLSTDAAVPAKGGAAVAGDTAILSGVVARNNTAISPGRAYGGAVFAYGSFFAGYSTFRGNEAYSSGGALTVGGAIYGVVGDKVELSMSTLSGNRAVNGAALALATVVPNPQYFSSILESTIAGNISDSGAAIHTHAPLAIGDSTIAFNTTLHNNGYPAGLFSDGNLLKLYSTIAANNVTADFDFDVDSASPIVGTNNLITAAINVPPGTLSTCPRLSRLGDYGGPTQTIALLSGSPAIDAGIDATGSLRDQRNRTRTAGAATDIGAFERQVGEVLDPLFRSTFDSRCE